MEKVGGDLSKFYGLLYKKDRLIGDFPRLMCQLDSKICQDLSYIRKWFKGNVSLILVERIVLRLFPTCGQLRIFHN